MFSQKHLINDLSCGDLSEAYEAAKELARRPRPPVDEISAVLEMAPNEHNRLAAAYALAWIPNGRQGKPLGALLAACTRLQESPLVRAQAIEGLGVQAPGQRSRWRAPAETAILQGLDDPSAAVRFWACYSAGEIKFTGAVPVLQRLAHSDQAVCPGWWRVADEAADAIERIYGRTPAPRTPLAKE